MTIEIRELDVRYGETHAVRKANLRVAEGELVAVLGPSGSGKSSLLHAVAGLIPTSGGSVRANGTDITITPPDQRGFPTVFQGGHLFAHMRAWENVAFGLRMRGVSRAERKRLALVALHEVELHGLEERYPGEVSGGQAQRVALARALVLRPAFALFDEPFSHLDPSLRNRMHDLVAALRERHAFGGLFVTHDHEEAFRLADCVAIMLDGELVQVGTPREVYEQPANERVAAFLGLANVLDATISQGSLRVAPFAGLPVAGPDGRARVVVRPETIHLHPVSARVGVPARIARVLDGGERTRYVMDVDGIWLEAVAVGPPTWSVGERLRVELTATPWILGSADPAAVGRSRIGIVVPSNENGSVARHRVVE